MRFVQGDTLAEQIAAWHARDGESGGSRNGAVSGSAAASEPLLPAPDTSAGIESLIGYFVPAAKALAPHECGVVHHDVKPGNLVVQRDGRPMSLDLGLA